MFGSCSLKTSLQIITVRLLRARGLSAGQQLTTQNVVVFAGGFFSYGFVLELGSLLVGPLILLVWRVDTPFGISQSGGWEAGSTGGLEIAMVLMVRPLTSWAKI